MSSDLRAYIHDIKLRNARPGRHWYWEKNAGRPRAVANALEFNPITWLLKSQRYIARRRMLAPLMASNHPSKTLRKRADFNLIRENGRPNSFYIEAAGEGKKIVPAADCSLIPLAPALASGNRKLVILHAYYEDEASAIFEKLRQFDDYDLILTTSIPAIRDKFLDRFDARRCACFLAPNVGRDVLPFLFVLAFYDIVAYRHFVKIHTKRSSHLSHGSKWFSANVEVLVGQKAMTDELCDLIDPAATSIYGLECQPLHDHFRNNRNWLEFLIPGWSRSIAGSFVPGTMFAGSAEFLRQLGALNLHLLQFEQEKGQLDGCLIHALERFFGYFAGTQSGECATFDKLIAASQKPTGDSFRT